MRERVDNKKLCKLEVKALGQPTQKLFSTSGSLFVTGSNDTCYRIRLIIIATS